MASLVDRLKNWASALKRDVVALWIAARDPRVPWFAKVLAAVVAAYALSPIDLIPDFIPILGYLDDLLIIPLGVVLAVRLIPSELMLEFRQRASALAKPRSSFAAVVIVLVWLTLGAALMYLVWRKATNHP